MCFSIATITHFVCIGRDPEHPITVASYVDVGKSRQPLKVCLCSMVEFSLISIFSFTTGPLPRTLVDFWRLTWQEKTPIIVMTTDLIEGTMTKFHQYWPGIGSQFYGPFQITITDQQTMADYYYLYLKFRCVYQTLHVDSIQLMCSLESCLQVMQFHYTAWPDHGIPDYTTHYWPTSEEIQVGEFNVNLLGKDNLPGFIICALSVLHNKVGYTENVLGR